MPYYVNRRKAADAAGKKRNAEGARTGWLMNMASDHLDLLPQRFEQHPLTHGDPLKQSELELGPYRFRIGNDCVDFDLNGQEIAVLRVAHRREIYKR